MFLLVLMMANMRHMFTNTYFCIIYRDNGNDNVHGGAGAQNVCIDNITNARGFERNVRSEA
jgi:hypothetical protein